MPVNPARNPNDRSNSPADAGKSIPIETIMRTLCEIRSMRTFSSVGKVSGRSTLNTANAIIST